MTKRIEPVKKAAIMEKLRGGNAKVGEICREFAISRPTLCKYREELRSAIEKSEHSEEITSGEEELTEEELTEEESSSDDESTVGERVFINQSVEYESDPQPMKQVGSDPQIMKQVGSDFIKKHFKSPNVRSTVKSPKSESTVSSPNVKSTVKSPKLVSTVRSPNVTVKSPNVRLESDEIDHSEARESTLRKIEAYLDAFPDKLATFHTGKTIEVFVKIIQQKDSKYLQGLLEAMRFRVQNSGLGDSALLVFAFATQSIEQVGGMCGLKLKGLSGALVCNSSARQALKELSIEMLSDHAAKPHQRLALVLLTTIYDVHTKNTLEENTKDFLDQPLRGPGEGMDPVLLEEIRQINITMAGT